MSSIRKSASFRSRIPVRRTKPLPRQCYSPPPLSSAASSINHNISRPAYSKRHRHPIWSRGATNASANNKCATYSSSSYSSGDESQESEAPIQVKVGNIEHVCYSPVTHTHPLHPTLSLPIPYLLSHSLNNSMICVFRAETIWTSIITSRYLWVNEFDKKIANVVGQCCILNRVQGACISCLQRRTQGVMVMFCKAGAGLIRLFHEWFLSITAEYSFYTAKWLNTVFTQQNFRNWLLFSKNFRNWLLFSKNFRNWHLFSKNFWNWPLFSKNYLFSRTA